MPLTRSDSLRLSLAYSKLIRLKDEQADLLQAKEVTVTVDGQNTQVYRTATKGDPAFSAMCEFLLGRIHAEMEAACKVIADCGFTADEGSAA